MKSSKSINKIKIIMIEKIMIKKYKILIQILILIILFSKHLTKNNETFQKS